MQLVVVLADQKTTKPLLITFLPEGGDGPIQIAPGTHVDIPPLARSKNRWAGFLYALGFHSEPFRFVGKATSSGGLTRFSVPSPMALTYAGESGLAVLSSNGNVHVVDITAPKIRIQRVCSAPFPTFDIAASTIEGRDTLFLAASSPLPVSAHGQLPERAGESKPMMVTCSIEEKRPPRSQVFLGSSALTGIAVHPRTGTVYTVNSWERQIYAREIVSSGFSPSFKIISDFPDAAALGPLAIDAQKDRLFVLDSVSGKLFEVDLTRLTKSVFAYNLNDGRALAVSGAKRLLYVARRREVVSVALDDAADRKTVWRGLKDPTGLAVDSTQRLWIADRETNSVVGPI
jgi:DNA-binding beta-propeller fold protein YncE